MNSKASQNQIKNKVLPGWRTLTGLFTVPVLSVCVHMCWHVHLYAPVFLCPCVGACACSHVYMCVCALVDVRQEGFMGMCPPRTLFP